MDKRTLPPLRPSSARADYAEREAASEALERLGRSALPVLRAARDSRDLEIRNRAHDLIQKIEGALLTQPSKVKLDFENKPLVEVMRSLSQQTGFKVALYPGESSQVEVPAGDPPAERSTSFLESHRSTL